MAEFERFLVQGYVKEDSVKDSVITIANATNFFPRTWNISAFLDGFADDLPEVQNLFSDTEYELKFDTPNTFRNLLLRIDAAIAG
jgi:hypothetical protein